MIHDLYFILGLTNKATPAEIKQAYHSLLKEYHPDRNDDPEAVKKLEKIIDTYKTLTNPQKKGEYEKERAARVTDNPTKVTLTIWFEYLNTFKPVMEN
ncbi:DnaJ domain-containing protein [Patescibacteria group bacterium]|nr:DnaJ domain-containing protein [Patescibacteria group bacterium]